MKILISIGGIAAAIYLLLSRRSRRKPLSDVSDSQQLNRVDLDTRELITTTFTDAEWEQYEQGVLDDELAFNARQKKDYAKAAEHLQRLLDNKQWHRANEEISAYDTAGKLGDALIHLERYDEAFDLASQMIAIGFPPSETKKLSKKNHYGVEHTAKHLMYSVCRKQGHLRDATYHRLGSLTSQALNRASDHRSTIGFQKRRPSPPAKARITDAAAALGPKNSIGKILELPEQTQREIAELCNKYIYELDKAVYEIEPSELLDATALSIFDEYQRRILDLLPDIPKSEMTARTKAFDSSSKK